MTQPPRKLTELSFLFIDCQTTGATPSQGHLLEIAWLPNSAAGATGTEIVSHLLSLPDGAELPRRISKITGIVAQEIEEDGVAPESVRRQFVAALTDASADQEPPPICVAHYARFEQRFVKALLEDPSAGDSVPRATSPRFICSYELAKRLLPDLPRHTIRALAGYFGFSLGELRRASDHVAATARIWQGLLGLLEERGICDTEALDHLVSKPARRSERIEFPIDRTKLTELPHEPGIYRFLDANERVLYVGKATSLNSRVRSYFRPKGYQASSTREMLTQVVDVAWAPAPSPLEAALLEIDEIQNRQPPYNSSLRVEHDTLFYLSRSDSEITTSADAASFIGPFPSVHGPRTLRALVQLTTHTSWTDESLEEILFSLGIPRDTDEALDFLAPGAQLLSDCLGGFGTGTDPYEGLLATAAALWPWYATREKTDNDGSDEPDETGNDDDLWTAKRVARRFVGALCHTGQLHRRALWLQLVERLTLQYKFSDRPLVFAPSLSPTWIGLTSRSGYDQAVVLTREIRALLRRGTFNSLSNDTGVCLDARRARRILGWF